MSTIADSPSDRKNCPICGQLILAVARKCRYCGGYLDPSAQPHAPVPGSLDRMLLPVGRPTSAIAAGYLALFSVLPLIGLLPGVAAVICGMTALKSIRNDPSLLGKGRAWFGIILGGLTTAITAIFIAIGIISAMIQHR
jgi:Domain of unknown function (DUF4190)